MKLVFFLIKLKIRIKIEICKKKKKHIRCYFEIYLGSILVLNRKFK